MFKPGGTYYYKNMGIYRGWKFRCEVASVVNYYWMWYARVYDLQLKNYYVYRQWSVVIVRGREGGEKRREINEEWPKV